MGEEGEFRKRSILMGEPWDERFVEIKDIDEAAKEFPTLEPVKISEGLPLKFREQQRQAEENAIKYIQEVQKWREKWLGKKPIQ